MRYWWAKQKEPGMTTNVCIIGAGVSGISAVKALKDQGIPFDCFEMSTDIGGLWKYHNDNGRSAAYRGLHINTSKRKMQFSDYPMPKEWPHYPHHTQVWRYFSEYCHQFDLRRHITFRAQVEHVEPINNGADGYRVTVRDLDSSETRIETYRAVIVCNGHHWSPKIPNFPGHFDGETLHAINYDTPEQFQHKRVLVVGIGNSGVDIAAETSYVSQKTFLSTRHSAWIIPRFTFGVPVDTLETPFSAALPLWLKRAIYQLVLRIVIGDQSTYGIPKPDHKLLSAHPTMSSALLERAAHGEILFKPNIKELRATHVLFEDGSEEAIDTLIYATGYYVSFPFFDESFIKVDDNQIPLYRRVVHPDHPNLYFIGLFQVNGAVMPIAELQAKWVAGLLSGALHLPERQAMIADIERDRRTLQKRFIHSTRHTIQIDYWPYVFALRKALRLGVWGLGSGVGSRGSGVGEAGTESRDQHNAVRKQQQHSHLLPAAIQQTAGKLRRHLAFNSSRRSSTTPPVVIITGAANGIGRQLAQDLIERGDCRLVLCDIDEVGLKRTFGETGALCRKLDVTRLDSWRALFDAVMAEYSRIDALFNIAGVVIPGWIHEIDAAAIDTQVNVNVKGVMYGSKLAAELMVRQGSGQIINMASLAGIGFTPGNALYCGSKHAVRGFSIALAAELRSKGVSVSCVCPGVVDTAMLQAQLGRPEGAISFTTGTPLTTTQMSRLLQRVMATRPVEVCMPNPFFSKLVNLFPGLTTRLYRIFQQYGMQSAARLQRELRTEN
jgi:cation diffusion facilitator CzcD-associated flavoprotein CzcO/NAD(P)-dependent dehydrogenase (short-subunit alcohol dehydrogenase family)